MYIGLATKEGSKEKSIFFSKELETLDPSIESFRISPIFPVDPSIAKSPLDLSNFFILFCFPKNSFSSIGRLCAKLNDERVGTLWFSHGLASLISLSERRETLDEILSHLEDEIFGYEIWDIIGGIVVDASPSLFTRPPPQIGLPQISNLPPEVQALLLEYFACMKTALSRAVVYMPYYLRVLQGLHHQVVNIIDVFIYIHTETPPDSLRPTYFDLDLIKSQPDKKLQVSKNLIDHILQINAALSYVITQGFSGVSPILEHECPIRSFSFLGTGTAFNALCKIYESISKVFAKFPVQRTIKEFYETDFSPIPIFRNFAEYEVDSWKACSAILDKKLSHARWTDEDTMFHLSFFSGTRGFRETLYSISAALQTITSCSMPRWTLVTLTHEYLHAHIRALMAVLHHESRVEEFRPLYDQYLTIETPTEDPLKVSLRKRLFFIVLASCEASLTFKKSAKELREGKEGENRSKRYTPEKALTALKDSSREINEYLVHTLDFLYFYEGDRDLYIRLVWLTWSTLPEIYERLSHYLLRTILATSVNLRGDVEARFVASYEKVVEVFESMISSGKPEDSFVIQQALTMLRDIKELSALRLEFNGFIRIADLARHFFHSLSLHREIKLDDLQVMDDNNNPVYPIKPFEFQDQDIQSPIAFIVDKAKQRLLREEDPDYEEILKESCWELLVVSSSDI